MSDLLRTLADSRPRHPGGVVAVGNQRRLGQFRLEIVMLCQAAPAAKPSPRKAGACWGFAAGAAQQWTEV